MISTSISNNENKYTVLIYFMVLYNLVYSTTTKILINLSFRVIRKWVWYRIQIGTSATPATSIAAASARGTATDVSKYSSLDSNSESYNHNKEKEKRKNQTRLRTRERKRNYQGSNNNYGLAENCIKSNRINSRWESLTKHFASTPLPHCISPHLR